MMFVPVTFVSLGPGDPELITLKGLKCLQRADIIYCPSTETKDGKILSRAKDILLELGIVGDKITLFNVPMSKDRSKALESYRQVSEQIARNQKNGKMVAVTAEGDAGFYSSVHYINENLSEINIPIERIAGVPAFIACAAIANVHTVKLEEVLHIIPGIITTQEIKEKIEKGDPIVIMKPSQSEDIIKEAISSIASAKFHYFENVGVKEKEFYTHDNETILERKFPYFSLLIIQKNEI